MITMLRRLFWLALLGGGGFAAWNLFQRQQQVAPAAPEWPPLGAPTSNGAKGSSTTSASPAHVAPPAVEPAPAGSPTGDQPPTWVAPVDGACPDGYSVKANDNSGIFHVPGGRFYERTVPERCYARVEDAQADGYRAAKA
jgi:hypothetical protein